MKIKYDRRVMRIILITAVVVSVPTLAGMICGVFFDDIVSTFCDVMMVTSVITFCPMVGLWLACMDAWLYLRELVKAGYEVPDDRRKYNCVLENLPREREDYCIVDGRDWDSVISACRPRRPAAPGRLPAIWQQRIHFAVQQADAPPRQQRAGHLLVILTPADCR